MIISNWIKSHFIGICIYSKISEIKLCHVGGFAMRNFFLYKRNIYVCAIIWKTLENWFCHHVGKLYRIEIIYLCTSKWIAMNIVLYMNRSWIYQLLSWLIAYITKIDFQILFFYTCSRASVNRTLPIFCSDFPSIKHMLVNFCNFTV